MSDPRDFDRRMDMGGMDRPLEMEHRMGSPWGWIAGAVFVISHAGAGVQWQREHTHGQQRRKSAGRDHDRAPGHTVPLSETTGQGGQRGQ